MTAPEAVATGCRAHAFASVRDLSNACGRLASLRDPRDRLHDRTPSPRPSESLRNVRYEIRGRLARRAYEMERQGYEIISLNIGNPGAFGFRTPETMRLAMIENLGGAKAYCHQKGIFPAREAVVMQQQARGVQGVTRR